MNKTSPPTIAMTLLILLLALPFTACEEKNPPDLPGEEIDCLWFAARNCWRDSLSAIAPLLPVSGTSGVLAADGKSCTYDNGLRFTFVNPLDPARLGEENYLRDFRWDLEGHLDGDFFMAYREPEATSVVLQSSLGLYVQALRDGSLGITCPNTEMFKVTVAALLSSCDQNTLPGRKTFWDETGVVFALKGTDASDLLVFNCKVE